MPTSKTLKEMTEPQVPDVETPEVEEVSEVKTIGDVQDMLATALYNALNPTTDVGGKELPSNIYPDGYVHIQDAETLARVYNLLFRSI